MSGELSLSYTWPAADRWPLMWVKRPLQGQPTRPTQPFILSRSVNKWVVSCNRMCTTSLGRRRLVNAYRVKAGWFIPFVDKREWQVKLCDPSNTCHFRVHYRWFTTIHYTKRCLLYFTFTYFSSFGTIPACDRRTDTQQQHIPRENSVAR